MIDTKGNVVGAILLLIAGAAIVAGALLDWFVLDTPAVAFEGGAVSGSYSGLDTGAFGWAALAAGAIVVVAGLVWIATRSGGPASIIAVLAGVVAAGIGVYQLSRIDSAFVELAASKSANDELPADKITDLLTRLIDGGQMVVDPGIGVYLVLGGGIAAGLVGIIGVFRAGRDKEHSGYEAPAFTVPGGSPPEGLSTDR